MTEQTFKEITQLQDKIYTTKNQIQKIENLIGSLDMECIIIGKPKGTYEIEYRVSNLLEVIKILELDKTRLQGELSELQKEFESL